MTLKDELETATGLRSLPYLLRLTRPNVGPLFLQLATLLQEKEIETDEINFAILSQWALMSGWGTSSLALTHFNFAGIKWRPDLGDLAGPIPYKGEQYCRFESLEKLSLSC